MIEWSSCMLVEIKKALVVEEGGESADNIPPHVKKFHFKNNVTAVCYAARIKTKQKNLAYRYTTNVAKV